MIKADLYKLHTNNYFTGVKLDLFPTEMIIYVNSKKFSFMYNEIVYHKSQYNKFGEETIIVQLEGIPKNLNIVIKPYNKVGYDVICNHLNAYSNNAIPFIVNPIHKI